MMRKVIISDMINIFAVDSLKRLKILYECRINLSIIFNHFNNHDHYLELMDMIESEELVEWDKLSDLLNF